MAATFQIVRIAPVYCSITDGLIGSKAHPLPMPYVSEALAHKLAGRLHQAEYDGCGDDSFVVVPYGASPYSKALWPAAAPDAFDDMPF